MGLSEYQLMQSAVDIVPQSEHPANKVAATITGLDILGVEFALARTNYWPEPIKMRIGRDTRIGNASGTVHAETACLLSAPMTHKAALFVTDVPCPNCVKNMAEAGITSLYIDHKGFAKDFALRRGGHFESMSLRICEKAGINVFRIYRKEKRSEHILKISENFTPVIEKPGRITPFEGDISGEVFRQVLEAEKKSYGTHPFALAIASAVDKNIYILSAETHPCPGYTMQTVERGDEKYSTILQPVHRLIMMAARYGLKIQPGYLFSSRVPTARELVDLVGAGLTHLRIGDTGSARDNDALTAFKQLKDAGIII
jgi:dCMP deaminase